MNPFRALKNPHSDDHESPGDLQGADGLPDGLEPPPIPRLVDLGWQTDLIENARLGIPRPGCPSRPLAYEEAAVNAFNADMHELSKWAQRQRAVLPSLLQMATTRCDSLDLELDRLDAEIAVTEADVAAQRDQLAEQYLKFPWLSGTISGPLIVGTSLVAGLETVALQPVVGEVFATADLNAWAYSALAVGSIGYSSWRFGGVLHQWLAYEGPPRIRRALGWKASAFGAFSGLALAAVVGIRLLGSNQQVTSAAEALFAAFLYGAVQGLVQLAAITHGWRHDDPRVRELANTEAHLAQLRVDRDAVEDARGEAHAWAGSLEGFNVSTWLTEHRAQLAADYASEDLSEYRNPLEQALRDAGREESADMLLILPLPKFVPPIDSEPDDDGDWVTGFMLPL